MDTAVGAMSSATDPNTSCVKLLSHVTRGVSIGEGKFTLDLNGKTWDTNDRCRISGATTHITIKDSGTGGTIERIAYMTAGPVLTVSSGAQLTLNSGTIQAISTMGGAINAYSTNAVNAGGLITINGGTIRQVQNQGSAPKSAVHLGAGGFVMTGGTIESNSQAATLLLYGGNNSIKGGTISNTVGERAVGIAYDGTLDISGGTMNASGTGSMSYAIYGYSNKATIRLSGAPIISGKNGKIYAQKDVSLQANIDGSYYTGDKISIFYKGVDQQMETTLVTGLKDVTQAANFSLINPMLSGGTPYDDTKKTLFIGKIPAEAQWTTNKGSSWTEGSFLKGVEAMKLGAKDADTSTLQLLNDINTLAEKVYLSSDSTTAYTLDLNGKTLNAANAVWKDYFAIDRGRVDIKDSVGSGQIKGWDNSSAALLRVNNDSTLILKSGTLASSAQGIFVTTGTMRIEGGRIESYDEAVYGSGNCSIDILGGELQSQTTNLITTIGTLRLYGNPKLTAGKDCSTIAAYAAGKIYACSSDGSVSYTGSPVTISCKWDDKKSGDIVVQEVTDPTVAGLFTATDIEPLVLKTPDNYPGNLTLAAKKLTGIAITTPPTKKAYRVGETFDPAGMVVTATYDDATTEVITTYTVTPSEKLTALDTTITVSYKVDDIEESAEQEITVEAPFTVKFDVDGTVTQKEVFNGEKATKPADPIKTGYTFKGWFATEKDPAFDFATPITADLTLTAELVDETAPIDVKILYYENDWKEFANTATFGLFFKDTVNVKLTAKDEGSGVKEFTYTLGNVTKTTLAENDAVEFSIEPGYKGNISNVTATDNDTNKSDPAVGTEHFAIDKEAPGAPTVDKGTYTSGEWTKDDVTFTLSGASALSGIEKYQYSTDGGTVWKDAAVVTKTDATETETYNVIKAKVEVKDNCNDGYIFRAVSNSKIEGTSIEKTVVNIDKVVPTITVKGKTDAYLVDDTAQIVVTAGESKATVEVQKDSGIYTDITTTYEKGYKVTENGTYTFRVTNGAGVTSEASITYTMIDPRKPVVTIDSGDYESDTWENKKDIKLNVTQDILEHGKIVYKIDETGTWQDYTTPIVISKDCKATVYTFKAISGAGVKSDEKSITVKRDTTAPEEVEISYKEIEWKKFLNNATFGLFFKDTVKVRMEAKEEGSGIKEFSYTMSGLSITSDAKDNALEFSIKPRFIGNFYYVTATDNAGNTSQMSRTQSFAIDNAEPTPPRVLTNGYVSGEWAGDTVTFTLSEASAISRIAKYQYSTDGGETWTDATVVRKIDATQIEPDDVIEAKVEVSGNCEDVGYMFRAVSNVGIESTNSEETKVWIDEVEPVITVSGNTKDYLIKDTAKIEVTTVGKSGVIKVEAKKDAGEYEDITASYTKDYEVTENGTYTFRVTNGAGVESEASIKYEKIDPRTPVVTIDSGDYKSDTWENKSDITLNVTENLKHGVMQYKIGDGEWQKYSAPIVISEDCKATVYTFKATSGAGVVSEEKSITVKRDTTSPDGDITFNKSSVKKFINQISFGLFFKESVDVKLTGTDVTSEVKSIEYTKSNKVLTQAEVMAVGEWTEESEFSLTPVDEEKFIIYVKITDKAENVFVFGSNGSQFDLTAPAITGVSDKVIYYTTQEAEVKDKNLAEIKLDGNPASSPISLAGDRDCSYVIEAKDKAGNTTSITVVMKSIASLTATIDALTTENVKSSDQTTVNAVKDAVEALISGKATKATKATNATKATKEEQAALQAITDKCEELLTKIEEVATESQRVVDTTDSYRVETVKSTDKEAVETVKTDNETLLATDNLTQEERDALTKVANTIVNLLTKLDQVAAESQRIIDAANSYNVETVKSADKETLETLKAANEALLATENLTEEEKEVLTEVTGTIADILTKIEEVATESQRIIDTANSFKLESVKTADREALETLKAASGALQATDSLTEEERGILTEVDTAITNLLLKVDQVVAESQRIIDAANGYKVETAKSADKEALEILKAANETLLATDNLTEKERETITEVAAAITNILTKLDDVAAEKQRIIDTANSYNVETVKSADKETLETLKAAGEALLATENLMEEERAVLIEMTGTITALLTKIEEVATENQRIIDTANSFKPESVKTVDREALETLKAANEALQATDSLTEEEREILTEVAAAITNLLLKVVAESQRIIDTANSYNVEIVKSADKETLETLKAAGEALLATENLMEEERAVLTEANDKINALFAKVNEAEKASKPESFDEVKDINESNVKMTDKEQLIQAKTELEQSLSGFEGNYTEDEKAVIKEKIVQIEKALKAISNVQEVIDAIAGLPKPGDVKKEDSDKIQAAKKLYDSLPEHQKSMIAKAEIDKLTTAVKALEKELNKKPSTKPSKPTTVPKAVKTGDDAAPMPYAVSMLLSCIIVLGLAFGKRKIVRK